MATIAIIGSGAVGSLYGARLARAGHAVRFLMRRDLTAVRERGLDVRSCDGDFRLHPVDAHATPESIGKVDWVICSLKATALDEAEALIRPCVGERTRVVALMNGLGIEDTFAGWLGRERVFGAMAFVCINRGAPGVVHHLDYGRVTVGHLQDDPSETQALYDLFASADVETLTAPNLRYARWEKLCWNIPFSGLSVAAGGVHTGTILATPELRALVAVLIAEVVAVANADLAAAGHDGRLDATAMTEKMLAQTATMGDYRPSMVIDYALGQAMEVDTILGAPLRRAVELGVATPAMQAFHALVAAADLHNRGAIERLRAEDVHPSKARATRGGVT